MKKGGKPLEEVYTTESILNRMSPGLIDKVVQRAKDSGFYSDKEINEHFYPNNINKQNNEKEKNSK